MSCLPGGHDAKVAACFVGLCGEFVLQIGGWDAILSPSIQQKVVS